ncbi:MAG TPA: prepilin peptidase [Actinomycetota bacterium]|jgi:leader peptidase (prepilin peptidase)/N-methyltransferase|nr:prepilin peptidase [Actinomycetota bacterium]
MVWLRALVALPFGLALGSFMTVAVHRLPARESVVRPRSRCPRCGVEIRSRDNIPVISWLLLRGRCRSCGHPISRVYPLTELTTAGLVVAAVLRFDRPWEGALVAGLLSLMPALAIIDIRHRILPNKLTHPALVIFPIAVVVAWIFDGGVDPVRALIGGLAYGGALFIVALVSGGMGMGDVKLAAVIGIVFGAVGLRYVAVAASGAILFGGVAAVISLILGADRKSMIPFGPWIAAGAVVAGFWGDRLASAYLSRVT